MEKMVEIANFQHLQRAEILASMLRAEGIRCYVRNAYSTHILQGSVDIGARVEILETDLPQALDIMRQANFADDQLGEASLEPAPEFEAEPANDRIDFRPSEGSLSTLPFDKKLIVLILFLVLFLLILIAIQTFFV